MLGEGRDGLALHERHYLVYAVNHGRLQWAPLWLLRAIVHVWNGTACILHGHRWFGPIPEEIYVEENGERFRFAGKPETCMSCCKVRTDRPIATEAAPQKAHP